MIRLSKYSIEDVFSSMEQRTKYPELPDGKRFRKKSARLKLFKTKGVKCVKCDLEGSFFALETHDPKVSAHINLYAVIEDEECGQEKEVLMTKDHIFPRSKGGANNLDNYQTMCSPCNHKKANRFVS